MLEGTMTLAQVSSERRCQCVNLTSSAALFRNLGVSRRQTGWRGHGTPVELFEIFVVKTLLELIASHVLRLVDKHEVIAYKSRVP